MPDALLNSEAAQPTAAHGSSMHGMSDLFANAQKGNEPDQRIGEVRHGSMPRRLFRGHHIYVHLEHRGVFTLSDGLIEESRGFLLATIGYGAQCQGSWSSLFRPHPMPRQRPRDVFPHQLRRMLAPRLQCRDNRRR
jgi:hypothetical protein